MQNYLEKVGLREIICADARDACRARSVLQTVGLTWAGLVKNHSAHARGLGYLLSFSLKMPPSSSRMCSLDWKRWALYAQDLQRPLNVHVPTARHLCPRSRVPGSLLFKLRLIFQAGLSPGPSRPLGALIHPATCDCKACPGRSYCLS